MTDESSTSGPPLTIKLAEKSDLVWAQQLYNEVYSGNYPDPMINNYQKLQHYITEGVAQFMVVAKHKNGQVVGALRYRYDSNNLFAKVYGAIVHPQYRGVGVTEKLMQLGVNHIKQNSKGLDLVYAH